MLGGGIHGAGQVYEKSFGIEKQKKQDIYWIIRVICVFTFVTIAWIFFRAPTIRDALYAVKYTLYGISGGMAYFVNGAHALGITRVILKKIVLLYLLPLMVYDYVSLKIDICEWIGKQKAIFRYGYISILIFVILTCGNVGQSTFVYFQF